MLSTFDRATEALRESSDTSRTPDRAETIATLKEIQSWYNASPKLETSDDASAVLSPPMLLPMCGGVAYGEGSLVLSPERSVTVHLGGEFFAQMSPADAAGVLERRAAAEALERTVDDIMVDTMGSPPAYENKSIDLKPVKSAPAKDVKSANSSAAAFARGMETGFLASSSTLAKKNTMPPSGTVSKPPAVAGTQSLPTMKPEATSRPTRVEIQEESDDSENEEADLEDGGDDFEDDEDFDEDFELSSDGLFEIEEQVDAQGREVTAKAVNMQSKIQATEGFRNLLVNASMGDDDGNLDAASSKQPTTAAPPSLTGRSALPKEEKQRKRSKPPSGAKGKGKAAEKVPYADTVKALEDLMAAEDAASLERGASEAARTQGITSPAWSKGFFSSKASPPARSAHNRGSTDRPQPVVAAASSVSNRSSDHSKSGHSPLVASGLPEASMPGSSGPTKEVPASKSDHPPSRVAPIGLPQPMKTPVPRASATMQDLQDQDFAMSSSVEQPEEQKPMSKFKREQLARRERDSQRNL